MPVAIRIPNALIYCRHRTDEDDMADAAGTGIHERLCERPSVWLAASRGRFKTRPQRHGRKQTRVTCCCCYCCSDRSSVPYVEVPVLVQPTRTSVAVTVELPPKGTFYKKTKRKRTTSVNQHKCDKQCICVLAKETIIRSWQSVDHLPAG